jgi:protein subunit release factor B
MEIPETDLRVQVFRASAGTGWAVPELESTVRITHLPTGLMVEHAGERSQLQNKVECLKSLERLLSESNLCRHCGAQLQAQAVYMNRGPDWGHVPGGNQQCRRDGRLLGTRAELDDRKSDHDAGEDS